MYKYQIILLVLFLAFAGCEKVIILDDLEYEERVSVECLLVPGEVPILNLYRAVSFFTPDQDLANLFARNAEVQISSDQQVDILQMDSTYNKYFCRWEFYYKGSIEIVSDETYALHINYNGGTYTSETKTDVAAAQIDSVTYVEEFFDLFGEHEGVVVNFTDLPGMENYYRYQMNRDLDSSIRATINVSFVPCLEKGETYPISEIGRFIFFDRDQDGRPMKFVVEPAYKHEEGDTALVYLQTVNKEAADFYDSLDRQRQANLNPFIEPIFLKSNISNATGVFGSMNLSEPVLFVFPE